jgi:hypothetical protein
VRWEHRLKFPTSVPFDRSHLIQPCLHILVVFPFLLCFFETSKLVPSAHHVLDSDPVEHLVQTLERATLDGCGPKHVVESRHLVPHHVVAVSMVQLETLNSVLRNSHLFVTKAPKIVLPIEVQERFLFQALGVRVCVRVRVRDRVRYRVWDRVWARVRVRDKVRVKGKG